MASRTTPTQMSDSVLALNQERVLAVRTGGLSDVLLAEPALRALSADGAVTLMCERRSIPAAEMIAAVTEIIPIDDLQSADIDRSAVEAGTALPRGLRTSRAVVFTSALESPLPIARALRLGGVDFIVGRSTDGAGSLLDVRLAHDTDEHDVERNLELVEAMGLSAPFDRRVRVRPTVAPHLLPPDSVVVHPGASIPSRTPSPAVWREVISRLAGDGHSVVLTGSRRDLVAMSMRGARGVAVDLVGKTTFAELGSVLASAGALCVGRSAPMHLAAAVGTPVVVLGATCGCWRPWMVEHEAVGDAMVSESPVCARHVAASVARFVGLCSGAA